jgi:hypothetical protein
MTARCNALKKRDLGICQICDGHHRRLCVPKTSSRIDHVTESPNVTAMIALLCFFLTLFASLFKSKSRLEAENAALRHQLAVLRRKVRGRVHLTNGDRLFLVQLYRWFPSVLKAVTKVHLRWILRKYAAYYNEFRTHRSLNKDAPIHRAIQHAGCIVSAPVLGGLHHHYCRI